MTRSKKLFIVIIIFFLAGIVIASIDFARKTTFPGSKSQLKERIKKQFIEKDSSRVNRN
ncbi:MAG: hypothetical protein ACO3FI_11965 [Cyclobacteriaceae bacterium]